MGFMAASGPPCYKDGMLRVLRRRKKAAGGPWLFQQAWDDVLLAHWPVEAPALARLVPEPLELEERDGSAWLSVVALRVTVFFHSFAELNVRTYVRHGDATGVLFFTLDAGSPLAPLAGAAYGLPYRWTRTRMSRRGGSVYFDSRDETGGRLWQLTASYSGRGPVYRARPGGLEDWLVERRRLLTVSRGRVGSADIEHAPWPLQRAEVSFLANTLLQAPAVRPLGEPLLQYASHLDVLTGPPRLET